MMYQLAQTLNNITHDTLGALKAYQGVQWLHNPVISAMIDTLSTFTPNITKPEWKIEGLTPSVELSFDAVDVLRFNEGEGTSKPPMLLVSPLSGHYSTLLSDTVERLSKDFTVYITDWKNVRDTPAITHYGLDSYAQVLVNIFTLMEDVHVMAVCQACIPTLMAVGSDQTISPLSLTLMAGPLDTRVGRTSVNEYCEGKDVKWFEDKVIHKVPEQFESAGADVYAGFTQLMSFMSMNTSDHRDKLNKLYLDNMFGGDTTKSEEFYDEYLSVMDLPSKMYLDTISNVFLDQRLAKGLEYCNGSEVNIGSITCPVLTIEGIKDDICGLGQTSSVLELLTSSSRKGNLEFECGHYGTFSGKVWRSEIAPSIFNFCKGEFDE